LDLSAIIWLDYLAKKGENMEWRLADAKNKFSELVNNAINIEPQIIHRRNDSVVVISKKEYQRLLSKTKSFKDHLFNPPVSIDDLIFDRDKSPMRDFEI